MTTQGSLVGRLVVLAAIWAIFLLAAGGVALSALYRTTVFRDVDDRLDGAVLEIVTSVEVSSPDVAHVGSPPGDSRYSRSFSGRYWVVARLGEERALQVLAQSSSHAGEELIVAPALIARALGQPGAVVSGAGTGPNNEPLRIRAQSVLLDGVEGVSLIAAGEDRRPADRAIRGFALAASWVLAPFALGLIAAVFLQVRLGLAPLFRMSELLVDVREGERKRLDGKTPSELAPLANELNVLLDHNRDVVERARAHVGNLAHALKTPISVLTNEARDAEGALGDVVRRQVDAMSRQVDHHLKRASAAARAQSVGARTDATAVVDNLARTLPRMYPERGISLETQRPSHAIFRGEQQDLEEMVGNLLDNAFKWARSRVRAVVDIEVEPGRLTISVEDDGPGLPPEKRDEAIRRGARLDEAAPGSGLGLAIVDDLARAYGGRLRFATSEWGGLAARLNLPAASPHRRTTPR